MDFGVPNRPAEKRDSPMKMSRTPWAARSEWTAWLSDGVEAVVGGVRRQKDRAEVGFRRALRPKAMKVREMAWEV